MLRAARGIGRSCAEMDCTGIRSLWSIGSILHGLDGSMWFRLRGVHARCPSCKISSYGSPTQGHASRSTGPERIPGGCGTTAPRRLRRRRHTAPRRPDPTTRLPASNTSSSGVKGLDTPGPPTSP